MQQPNTLRTAVFSRQIALQKPAEKQRNRGNRRRFDCVPKEFCFEGVQKSDRFRHRRALPRGCTRKTRGRANRSLRRTHWVNLPDLWNSKKRPKNGSCRIHWTQNSTNRQTERRSPAVPSNSPNSAKNRGSVSGASSSESKSSAFSTPRAARASVSAPRSCRGTDYVETWKRGNALEALEPQREVRVVERRRGFPRGRRELALKRLLDLENFTGSFVDGGKRAGLAKTAALAVEGEELVVPGDDRRVEDQPLQHLGMRETGKPDRSRGRRRRPRPRNSMEGASEWVESMDTPMAWVENSMEHSMQS